MARRLGWRSLGLRRVFQLLVCGEGGYEGEVAHKTLPRMTLCEMSAIWYWILGISPA